MKTSVPRWTSALILVLSSVSAPAHEALPTTRDWSQTATEATATHNPILIAFTSPYCGYCERLVDDVLAPLSHVSDAGQEVLIREVTLNSGGKLTDFDGLRVRARAFVDRYQVFAVPTVVLVDVDGQELVEPIVGYSGKIDYPPRLRTAIVEAHRNLLGAEPARFASAH